MTYLTYIIAEHDTTFLQPVYEGGSTYHWYSLEQPAGHEIQPRFANVDNAKSYVLNVLKGIPARVGEAVDIPYYTAILDGNAAAAEAAAMATALAPIVQEGEQLQAKAVMLQSGTAQWLGGTDGVAYSNALVSTREAVSQYNAEIANPDSLIDTAAIQAQVASDIGKQVYITGSPLASTTTTSSGKPGDSNSSKEKSSDNTWMILLVGIGLLIILMAG